MRRHKRKARGGWLMLGRYHGEQRKFCEQGHTLCARTGEERLFCRSCNEFYDATGVKIVPAIV